MVLLIDNYDSFTWNLAHRLGELGARVKVVRNDATTVEEIAAAQAECIVLSPGPGRPEDAGASVLFGCFVSLRLPLRAVRTAKSSAMPSLMSS